MSIKVNGVEITDDEVAAELPFHQDTPQPLRSACIALALKRVMLDEAAEQGHPVADAEEAADYLLSTQVTVPVVDEASCRRHYEQYPERFRVGGRVDADHILFAVNERTPLDALRLVAKETLANSCSAQRCADANSTGSPSSAASIGTALRKGLVRRNHPIVSFSMALRSAPVPAAARTRPPNLDGSRRAASWVTSAPME